MFKKKKKERKKGGEEQQIGGGSLIQESRNQNSAIQDIKFRKCQKYEHGGHQTTVHTDKSQSHEDANEKGP